MRGTWLVVIGLMLGLYGVDKALAHLEAREVLAAARGHYLDGQKLLADGRSAAAVDAFRQAHVLERTNRDFDLALTGAELTAGRTEDAEATISEVLSRDSNDGRANLLMARVRMAQNRFNDAVAFYHRAIYGAWPDGSAADQMDARLELADQLARRGRNAELLSELLLLDMSAARNPKITKKVASLYLEAGSTGHAESAYREILQSDPKDAEAYDGLGEVELKRGEFRMAHGAFTAALRLRPDSNEEAEKVQLADRLAGLDPTLRRMGSVEKFKRSSEILYLTEDATLDCLGGRQVPEPLHGLLAQAANLRAEKMGVMPSNEAAEGRLELAVQMWKARLQVCKAQPAKDDLLAILIGKIEQ